MTTVKQLKANYVYNKNNYTIYFSGGYFYYSSWEYWTKEKTFKALKETVKKEQGINIILT